MTRVLDSEIHAKKQNNQRGPKKTCGQNGLRNPREKKRGLRNPRKKTKQKRWTKKLMQKKRTKKRGLKNHATNTIKQLLLL
jgi:hypothetical protein